MNGFQTKLIFGFCIFVILASLITPVFFLYKNEATYSTSKVSAIGSVDVEVVYDCGDGICEAGLETCSSCPADCGECPPAIPPSGGSTGSSGGAFTKKLANFEFDPNLIDVRLSQGESYYQTVEVKNTGADRLEIRLKVSEVADMVFLDKSKLEIKRGGSDEFETSILVAVNQEPGVYIGDVIGTAGDLQKNLQLVIGIYESEALISVDVDIPEENSVIEPGDDILGVANVFSKYNESVPVTIEYSIKDREDNIINSKEESAYLLPGETVFKQRLKTNEDIDDDYYFYYVTIKHENMRYEDADAFKIEKPEEYGFFSMSDLIYAGIILLVLLLLAIIIYVFRHKLFKKGTPIFGIKRKKEKEEEKKMQSPKVASSTIKKLYSLRNEATKNYNENLVKEYISIVRHFFSDYYKISYRFTFQELIREIKKIKIKQKTRVVSFIDSISDLSYRESTISSSQFKDVIDRTIKLVASLKGNIPNKKIKIRKPKRK